MGAVVATALSHALATDAMGVAGGTLTIVGRN